MTGTLGNRYLGRGVNSPVRAFRNVGAVPLMLAGSSGSTVIDVRGRLYTDFIMGWGALILGHQPTAVVQALRRGIARGILMGLTHPAEVELARLIVESVPSVEQVRFTVSGTEACLTAIKMARASTKRTKILAFKGGYHGHSESLIASASAGIPKTLARDTISVAYNDLEAVERVIRQSGHQFAAVIVEPVAANMGVVPPQTGFLKRLRTLTAAHGIVLVFDEVVTGFRLGLSGAQGMFNIHPDLTTFGKIIGGGLPIGAVGGPRRIMQQLAPEGPVYHGGTFAGHPLSMAAGVATLNALRAHPPYARLDARTRRLTAELSAAAHESGIAVQINQAGSMWTMFFANQSVWNADQAQHSRQDRFTRWANGLRQRGILVPPSPLEGCFVSEAHTQAQLQRLIAASRAVFRAGHW